MHWFWRAAIAVVLGTIIGISWIYLVHASGVALSVLRGTFAFLGRFIGCGILYFFPTLITTFVIYGILTRLYPPATLDNETRCRKCGYILRGIPEPRCSECGEKI